MILQYLMGILWTFLSAFLCQLLGICITKKKGEYSYSFIVGYIVYSFLVAIGGIPIQIFNGPWMAFFWYMCAIGILLVLTILVTWLRHRDLFSMGQLKTYICEHWFLYVAAIVLVGFGLTHVDTIWSNNNTDDGFYLVKMASFPYMEQPFRAEPSAGYVIESFRLSDLSYWVNTFELEGSFYLYITKMNPSLYARLFLSLFNLFVMIQAIHAFLYKLLQKKNLLKKEKNLQYYILPAFLIFVMTINLFAPYDASWTVVTAAYYGSSLVRVACLFILLLPLVDDWRLDKKAILMTIASCVVMVSKSTIALPLIVLCAISYLIVYGCSQKEWKGILLALLLIGVLIGAGYLLKGSDDITSQLINNTKYHRAYIWWGISLLMMGLLAVKDGRFLQLVLMVALMIGMIFVPEINDLFEMTSQYAFVAERVRYSLLVFSLITGCTCFVVMLTKALSSRFLSLGCTLLTVVFMAGVYVTGYTDASLREALSLYRHNPYLIPNSTVELGQKLESMDQEVSVLMSAGVSIDGHDHFSSSILRAFAPHARSIMGGLRIVEWIRNTESDFNGFNLKDAAVFDQFSTDPNETTTAAMAQLCQKYPFDCIVGTNYSEVHTKWLETLGYVPYDEVVDGSIHYTIYRKQR